MDNRVAGVSKTYMGLEQTDAMRKREAMYDRYREILREDDRLGEVSDAKLANLLNLEHGTRMTKSFVYRFRIGEMNRE